MKSLNSNTTEIENIQHFIKKNTIRIIKNELDIIDKELIPIDLFLNDTCFTIQVNDEYNDLVYNNDILNFIMVFRELVLIEDSTDYLHWCKLNRYNASNNKLLDYYKSICEHIVTIRNYFPNNTITYFISDLDFQLNSGIMQLLRSK